MLHEFAHKLDGIGGTANGFPPLRRGMSHKSWAEDFSQAYDALRQQVAAGESACIDPYAAASPAEYFRGCERIFLYRTGYSEKLLSWSSQATDAVLSVADTDHEWLPFGQEINASVTLGAIRRIWVKYE